MSRTLSLFVALVCLCATNPLSAQKVSPVEAMQCAGNYMTSVSKNRLKSTGTAPVRHRFSLASAAVSGPDTLYYVLNDSVNNAFVILSADKRCRPVLGYSDAAIFNIENQPVAFTGWMKGREKEIAHIITQIPTPDPVSEQQWTLLSSAAESAAITGTVIIPPLLQTTWNQGCYFNTLCPADPAGPCGHVWTGCTATAMAQIMKFWNYPTTGTGSESYTCPPYGQLTADFGATTYQWSQMPNALYAENEAVATLLYHCGVSVNMSYSPDGSGAGAPRDALVNYFDYSPLAQFVSKSSFSEADWAALIRSELDQFRPVWYDGFGESNPGHAFVCDGYDDAGYFHFNWGWGGYADGYFYLSSLNPGGSDFSLSQGAVIQIIPNGLPGGYQGIFLTSASVVLPSFGGSDSSLVVSSATWNASSDQPWLSLQPSTGNAGATRLLLTATENPGTTSRSATVTLTPAGYSPKTISVTQPAAIPVTPGGLKNALPADFSGITHLSLLGSIDARDFKVMRDDLPFLASLDLSRVTIAPYTGIEGTGGSDLIDYPQGEIPQCAFVNPTTHLSKHSLRAVSFPAATTSIGMQAFNRCTGLTKIILPPLVNTIGSSAFANCSGLKSIFIPASVTTIHPFAFLSQSGMITVDPGNPNYSSLEGLLFDNTKTHLITCPVSKAGRLDLPLTVTHIGNQAFYSCQDLTQIILPPELVDIGNQAFLYCGSLTGMHLPSSVATIGSLALAGLRGPITVDNLNPSFSALNGVLFNKSQTLLIQCPQSLSGDYTLPASVITIGTYAFFTCDLIHTLILPASVTTIEEYAFVYCSGLTAINLPVSLRDLGSGAFYRCPALTSVTIPASVSAISDRLFYECVGLTSVGLPSTLASIGAEAFRNCTLLGSITLPASVTSIKSSAFAGCSGLTTLTALPVTPVDLSASPGVFAEVNTSGCQLNVPFGTAALYSAAAQWQDFSPIVEVPGIIVAPAMAELSAGKDTVRVKVASSAPWSLSSSHSWLSATPTSGSTGVTSLALMAESFDQQGLRSAIVTLSATGLDSKTITVTQFGVTPVTPGYLHNLLQDQLATTSVLVLSGSIDARDFKTMRDDMPLLSRVDLSRVSIVAYTGTEGPVAGSNVAYPAHTIPHYAFTSSVTSEGKASLRHIRLPETATAIGQNAFCRCSSLETVLLPSSLTTIEYGAFFECAAMPSIYLPAAVTSIAFRAFFRFGGNITVDPANPSFSSSDGLLFDKPGTLLIQCPTSKIGLYTIPSTVQSIGTEAFNDCNQLTALEIPSSVTSIGTSALAYCSALTELTVHSVLPVDLSTTPYVFNGIPYEICTLKVPSGTTARYAAASQWRDFTRIEEIPGLFVSGNFFSFDASGGTASLSVSSSVNWILTVDAPWLGVSATSGIPGWTDLTLTVPAFTGTGDRSATVTLSAAGFSPVTVTITQYGQLNVVAGTLKEMLSGQLAVITHLKLAGTLDARDFKTMRDEMPLLRSIDLSAATIVLYQGTEGTYGPDSRLYPAHTIPDRAFYNAVTNTPKNSLETFIFPAQTQVIGMNSFSSCKSLSAVIFPESLTFIGSSAFSNCTGLTALAIPSGVTYLGSYAFSYCSGVKTVEAFPLVPIELSAAKYISYVFIGVSNNGCLLRVPFGSLAAYQAAEQWRDFTLMEEMPGIYMDTKMLSFGANASSAEITLACSHAWTLTSSQPWVSAVPASGLPGSFRILVSTASTDASTERKATLTLSAPSLAPVQVAVIQYGLSVVTPGLLASWPAQTLDTLRYLTLSGTLDARDFRVIRDMMPNLVHLDLSKTTIVSYTGEDGTYPWGSISFPGDEIPTYAFYHPQTGAYKSKLATVLLPDNLRSVGAGAFYRCTGLRSMTFPPEVRSIGNSAFYYCSALSSVVLPASIGFIGSSAFSSCQSLSKIYTSPMAPVNLDQSPNVFYNVNKTTAILYVPYGSRPAYLAASQWNEFLNIVEMEGIVVSAHHLEVGAHGGSGEVVVACGFPWAISSSQPWLTVNPASGAPGQHSVIYSVAPNETPVLREALLTVTADGQPPQTIRVTQFTTLPVTAGTLHDLLAGQLAGVTNLTLSGTIDARDFKTMRDEMPCLAALDLHDATIVEYSGTEGTAGEYETTYPALTVPYSAFFDQNSWRGKTTLTSVTLPASTVAIDYSAFKYCSGLEHIRLPMGITAISDEAFSNCTGLRSVEFPQNLLSIGSGAFSQCTALEVVVLPTATLTIKSRAFEGCTGLSMVSIPSSVELIEEAAFSSCSGAIVVDAANPFFASLGGLLYNKPMTTLIQCPVSLSGTLLLPATVRNIGNWAFAYCNQLSSVLLPSAISAIGDFAFSYCPGLQSMVLPEDLRSLGAYAFYSCSGLDSVVACQITPLVLEEYSTVFEGVNHATATLYVPFGTKAAYQVAPQWMEFENIVEMGGLMLSDASVEFAAGGGSLPLTLSSGGNWSATMDVSWLSLLPASGGAGLTPLSLTALPNSADTTRTATLTFASPGEAPKSLRITQYPVVEVTAGRLQELLGETLASLTSLTLRGTIDARDIRVMRDQMPLLATLDLRDATIVEYTGAEGPAGDYEATYPAHTFPMYGFLNPSTWQGNTVLQWVILPENLTLVDQTSFYNCRALKGVTFGSSLLTIGSNAFASCQALSELEFPAALTTIEVGAFTSCLALTAVTLPHALTSLGSIAFAWCSNLEYFSFAASVTYIGNSVLSGCTSLHEIVALAPVPPDLTYSPEVFAGVDTSSCILYVPAGSLTAYQNALQWQDFLHITAAPSLSMPLAEGWNLISFNTLPETPTALALFQPLVSNQSLLKVQDESGNSLEYLGALGNWNDAIGTLAFTEGYKVRMSHAENLPVAGNPVSLPLEIPLRAGWNIIGFPLPGSANALDVVDPLRNAGLLVKVMDEAGNSLENLGLFGGWQNQIGDFLPGKGYKVRVSAATSLVIGEGTPKSAVMESGAGISPMANVGAGEAIPNYSLVGPGSGSPRPVTRVHRLEPALHFLPVFMGHGTNHFNLHLVDPAISGLRDGDELALFDGALCVGSATLDAQCLESPSFCLTASANDGLGTTPNGFASGHPLSLRLYRDGREWPLTMEPLTTTGQPGPPLLFSANGSAIGRVQLVTTTTPPVNPEAFQVSCYPNPFSEQITLLVRMPVREMLSVDIHDQLGRKIRSLHTAPAQGTLSLVWDGCDASGLPCAPGLYFCRVNGQVLKIMLSRFPGE